MNRGERRMAALQRRKIQRRNWPRDACPGRGRVHPNTLTSSCPWCLPVEFYEDVLATRATP